MTMITLAPIICIVAMAVICVVQIRTADGYKLAYLKEKSRADESDKRADCISELLVGRITRVENAFLEAGFNAEKGTGNDKD